MLRLAPAIYIKPYNQTTTIIIGPKDNIACFGDPKPMLRTMKTNNAPSKREDCISSCICVLASYLITGLPVSMTHVTGVSSLNSPVSSNVPDDRLVNAERSLQTSSSPGPIEGKCSGLIIPNRIIMSSYTASSPLTSIHGAEGSNSVVGLMYKLTMLLGI